MVIQDYMIGQEFQLCSQSELSTADNNWQWDRRSLSGFIDKDLNFYPPQGLARFDEKEAEVSGVWRMQKGRPFELCCLGQTGNISVTFTVSSTQPPLGDAEHPFQDSITLTSSGRYDTYKWTDIVARIETAPGTRVKSLSAYQWRSGVTSPQQTDLDASTEYIYSPFQFNNSSIGVPVYWDSSNRPFGISVDFTNQGTLTYVPNKDALNPPENGSAFS